jgi:hypothetical protein
VIALALVGCGGEPESVPVVEPQVDPRFASAEALLDHYNELTCNRDVVDAAGAFDLFYAENDHQRRLLSVVRSFIPLAELDQAMWDQFGEAVDPEDPISMLTPNPGPAVMTEHTGRRAMAKEPRANGGENDLYLVEIGDRWCARVAARLRDRIRAGEFATADDARMAIAAAMMAEMLSNWDPAQNPPPPSRPAPAAPGRR